MRSSATHFSFRVIQALRANNPNTTLTHVQALRDESTRLGHSQRAVFRDALSIVRKSKALGLAFDGKAPHYLDILQNTSGFLPEVPRSSPHAILGRANIHHLDNTVRAYNHLKNAKQKSKRFLLDGKPLSQGSAELLERTLSQENVSSFNKLSPEAKRRILRSNTILNGHAVAVRSFDKRLVAARKKQLAYLNTLPKNSKKYQEASELLKKVDNALTQPFSGQYTHKVFFPNRLQGLQGQTQDPHIMFPHLPKYVPSSTRRNLGNQAETSEAHLEHRIAEQLSLFNNKRHINRILKSNDLVNQALLQAEVRLQKQAPIKTSNQASNTTNLFEKLKFWH